jgi:rifampicin phosphotransferase
MSDSANADQHPAAVEIDPKYVGGKAASLMRLKDAGFEVPPFFVVDVGAHRRAAGGRISSADKRYVGMEYARLGAEAYAYAVRSSGVAEDSLDFSYAGVFDTFLNVRGLEAVIGAIENCWASHNSAIAAAYRDKRAVTDDGGLAVVVQRMVPAEWSGVSFSADPLTQALSVCVINATPGLGDDLVSGRVTPEEIRVDSQTQKVIERRSVAGATPLPDWLISAVTDATRLAADRFGFPQDLEWASVGDKLFVLQSRPITTIAGVFHNRSLEPWLGRGDPDAPNRTWTRAYADEIWTPPVSPLFYDVQNLTLATAQRLSRDGDLGPVPPDIFKYYKAAPYMDAAVLERLYANLPRISRRPSLLDLLPADRREALMSRRSRPGRMLRRLWQFEIVKGRTWGISRNHRFLEGAWNQFLENARRLDAIDVTGLTDEQLDHHLDQTWQLAGTVGPECEVAVLYYAHDLKLLLIGLLDRWVGAGEERYGDVSSGLENSETVREVQAIWQAAASIRTLGANAVALAAASTWQAFRSEAPRIGAEPIALEICRFLEDHPHRGANYKDVIYPRWGDDPELLWGHVRALAEADTPSPSEINAREAEKRRDSQRSILSCLQGLLAAPKRAVLRQLFHWNERYTSLRDNHRFYYDYVWWLVRRHYTEVGRRLQLQGKLATGGDIFFLVRSEIRALRLGADPSHYSARIAVRRREWDQTKRDQPPRFLRHGYVPDEAPTAQMLGLCALKGVAASSGRVVGRARVVYDVADLARVRQGEILVTRQTDPGWTPAFSRIGALVLETGGVLAHGASLCREYGLPCVTAVAQATSLIKDGDLICVSGSDGLVTVTEQAYART